MKVKKLIKILKEYDKDAEVFLDIYLGDDNYASEVLEPFMISRDGDGDVHVEVEWEDD